jgi:hypothetical protein
MAAAKKSGPKTRAEVFQSLEGNPKYQNLHKAKDKLEAALSLAKAARDPVSVKAMGKAFDRVVLQMIKVENAALKKAGFKV